MKRSLSCIIASVFLILLNIPVKSTRAEVLQSDQETIRTQYVGKVLFFRTPYRMANHLEVSDAGAVKGAKGPGYWTMDGAVQVKDLEFHKDRVILKCTKLWANLKDDGGLHFFPASAALKGKGDYPATEDITFRTGKGSESGAQFAELVQKVFLGENESKLQAAPQPIVAYIQKAQVQTDVDPITGTGFSGTPPKVLKRPAPDLPREAQLVGVTGREDFVVLVDAQGNAAVVGFTHLLQYGIEDATIEAVKTWKFEPAVKDGQAVMARIPMSIDFKSPVASR